MTQFCLAPLIILSLVFGCQHDLSGKQKSKSLQQDSGSSATPLACPAGSFLTQWGLKAPQTPNLLPDLNKKEGVEITLAEGLHSNIRLDICYNSTLDTAELFQVQWIDQQSQRFLFILSEEGGDWARESNGVTFLVAKSKAKISSLKEALFGKSRALSIELPGYRDNMTFKIHAQTVNDSIYTLAGIVYANDLGNNIQPKFAGELSEGDPFAINLCDPGEVFVARDFVLATAQIQLQSCSIKHGVSGYSYRTMGLTIKDTNSSLPKIYQEGFKLTDSLMLAAKFNYNETHHNECDSWDLILPEVEYAVTRSSLIECGTYAGNAPRTPAKLPTSKYVFLVRYGDAPAIIGENE